MRRKHFAVVLLLVALAFLAWNEPGWSQSQSFPTRQLTYLIPFDPGGQSDVEARRQQPHLSRILGQQVIIDYKVGGGGALGWRELVKSKPDGYLFAGFNIPHTILQPLQQEVGYKTEQLVPVAIFQKTPVGLAVPANSPYKTLKDFIEAAKKEPGKLTVGGSSFFSGPHFATMWFDKLAGTKLGYVPFTGAAPQITALLGGHTDAGMTFSNDLVRFKDKLRILALATDERMKELPDVPTFKEQGFNLVEAVDRGVVVPPKTPEDVIKKLEKAFLEISANPEIQAEMIKQGFVPVSMGAAESKAYLDKLTAHYKSLFKEVEATQK
ncbi:MAG: tripartite tricarboxylate transporter substrate binding protein [Desulfomonile tiedjei]|nr:tripartite tricarboxylate transporter substrate binding protein [Desulfomonile tiedjei]